jgi:hypothetical protein
VSRAAVSYAVVAMDEPGTRNALSEEMLDGREPVWTGR